MEVTQMSNLELRQMLIRTELETIIAQAECLMEIMNIEGQQAAELMQNGADIIRMIANELISYV